MRRVGLTPGSFCILVALFEEFESILLPSSLKLVTLLDKVSRGVIIEASFIPFSANQINKQGQTTVPLPHADRRHCSHCAPSRSLGLVSTDLLQVLSALPLSTL